MLVFFPAVCRDGLFPCVLRVLGVRIAACLLRGSCLGFRIILEAVVSFSC